LLFYLLKYTKRKTALQIIFNKKKKKKITKEFGEVKEKVYIGRNIKINKMKYNNVIVDLKPRPVLQELIEDLTNKMLAQKRVLHMEQNNEHADYLFIEGLKSDIKLLDQVIERCYAQQELIDMRAEQIIGLN
jgi:hypothetical protein